MIRVLLQILGGFDENLPNENNLSNRVGHLIFFRTLRVQRLNALSRAVRRVLMGSRIDRVDARAQTNVRYLFNNIHLIQHWNIKNCSILLIFAVYSSQINSAIWYDMQRLLFQFNVAWCSLSNRTNASLARTVNLFECFLFDTLEMNLNLGWHRSFDKKPNFAFPECGGRFHLRYQWFYAFMQ